MQNYREELSCSFLLLTGSPNPPQWSEEILEGTSQHHTCVPPWKNNPCHQKKWKRLHSGYYQMPLTCYQQKPTPWHDSTSVFLHMMKHSWAICSVCGLCLRLQERLRNLLHVSECHISSTEVSICQECGALQLMHHSICRFLIFLMS